MDLAGVIFFFKLQNQFNIDVFSAGLKNESIKLSWQMYGCKDGESPTAECKLVLMSFFFSKGPMHYQGTEATERERIAMPKTTRFHSVIQLRLIRFAY